MKYDKYERLEIVFEVVPVPLTVTVLAFVYLLLAEYWIWYPVAVQVAAFVIMLASSPLSLFHIPLYKK